MSLNIELGQGAFATVFLITCDFGDDLPRLCAAKVLNMLQDQYGNNYDPTATQQQRAEHDFFLEYGTWLQAQKNNPSIIHVYEDLPDSKTFLLDFAPCGSLKDIVEDTHDKFTIMPNFDFTQKCIIAYGIANSLAKLHELNYKEAGLNETKAIVHRDIKPDNILLDHRLYPLIADFGTARFVDLNQKQLTRKGSPLYMSPEILSKKEANTKTDVYSFGMTLYHLFSGFAPFLATQDAELLRTVNNEVNAGFSGSFTENSRRSEDNPDFIHFIINELVQVKGCRPSFPSKTSEIFAHIIRRCWDTDQNNRPEMKEVAKEILKIITFSQDYIKSDHYHEYKEYLESEIYEEYKDKWDKSEGDLTIESCKRLHVRRINNYLHYLESHPNGDIVGTIKNLREAADINNSPIACRIMSELMKAEIIAETEENNNETYAERFIMNSRPAQEIYYDDPDDFYDPIDNDSAY